MEWILIRRKSQAARAFEALTAEPFAYRLDHILLSLAMPPGRQSAITQYILGMVIDGVHQCVDSLCPFC